MKPFDYQLLSELCGRLVASEVKLCANGIAAFELEDRVLYSATPLEAIEVLPEPVDVSDSLAEQDVAAMSASASEFRFLLSSETVGTQVEGSALDGSEIVQLGEPDLALGNDTTGTFSSIFDLDDFTSDDLQLRALHAVQHDFTLGVGVDSFDLRSGDIIFGTRGTGSLSGNSTSISVEDEIYLFRPDVVGVHDSGEFFVLLDNPLSSNSSGISLVDRPDGVTLPDGRTLAQGTFLFGLSNEIQFFQPSSVGAGTTGGNLGSLIFGASPGIDLDEPVSALHLVQEDMTLGGLDLQEGDILISLSVSDNEVGNPSVRIDPEDVGAIRLNADGSATGFRVFDGSNAGFALDGDNIEALAISKAPPEPIPNAAPTGILIDNDSIDENTDTATGVAIGLLSTIDSDDAGPFTYEIVGESPFSIANGNQLVLTGLELDYESATSHTVRIRTTDPGNLGFETDLTIFVNNINEAPTLRLENLVVSLAEGLSVRTRVADIVVDDDSLGDETLILSGVDQSRFEIVDDGLFLRADQLIEFDTQSTLEVFIAVDDPTLGAGAEDTLVHQIGVTQVDNAPAPMQIPFVVNPIGSISPVLPEPDLDLPESQNSDNEDIEELLTNPDFINRGDGINVGANDFENEPRQFVQVNVVIEPVLEIDDRPSGFSGIERGNNLVVPRVEASGILESQSNNESVFDGRPDTVGEYWANLEQLDEKMLEQSYVPQVAAGTVASIASIVTAGYLAWLIHGGQILIGLLTQLPAWNSLDMLTVLSGAEDEDEDESNSLESLVTAPDPETKLPEVENAEPSMASQQVKQIENNQ